MYCGSAQLYKKIMDRVPLQNMIQKVRINEYGAAENAFTLAASFILRDEETENVLIVLDGDVNRTKEEKLNQIKKKYSGTEEDAKNKREKAISLFKQYSIDNGVAPECFLRNLLCSIDDSNEIISEAKRIKAVNDSHEWINSISQALDSGTDTILDEIIRHCSKADGWNEFVRPIHDWLNDRSNI